MGKCLLQSGVWICQALGTGDGVAIGAISSQGFDGCESSCRPLADDHPSAAGYVASNPFATTVAALGLSPLCAAGYYGAATALCSSHGAAFELSGCAACVPGKYSEVPGGTLESDCIDCAGGKYGAFPGASAESACVACPPPFGWRKPGQSHCVHQAVLDGSVGFCADSADSDASATHFSQSVALQTNVFEPPSPTWSATTEACATNSTAQCADTAGYSPGAAEACGLDDGTVCTRTAAAQASAGDCNSHSLQGDCDAQNAHGCTWASGTCIDACVQLGSGAACSDTGGCEYSCAAYVRGGFDAPSSSCPVGCLLAAATSGQGSCPGGCDFRPAAALACHADVAETCVQTAGDVGAAVTDQLANYVAGSWATPSTSCNALDPLTPDLVHTVEMVSGRVPVARLTTSGTMEGFSTLGVVSSAPDDYYNGWLLEVTGGTAHSTEYITDYDGTSRGVTPSVVGSSADTQYTLARCHSGATDTLCGSWDFLTGVSSCRRRWVPANERSGGALKAPSPCSGGDIARCSGSEDKLGCLYTAGLGCYDACAAMPSGSLCNDIPGCEFLTAYTYSRTMVVNVQVARPPGWLVFETGQSNPPINALQFQVEPARLPEIRVECDLLAPDDITTTLYVKGWQTIGSCSGLQDMQVEFNSVGLGLQNPIEGVTGCTRVRILVRTGPCGGARVRAWVGGGGGGGGCV